MMQSDMFKLASLARPGYSALRNARKMFDVVERPPDAQDLISEAQGHYDPDLRRATIPFGAENPINTKRHEILHGYQQWLTRKNLNPVARFGATNMKAQLPDIHNSFTGGLRELALETDARIGAMKSIPKGVVDMAHAAPYYAKSFEGAGKIPFKLMGLLRHLV
jgi:hypothetical protein